MCFCSTGLLINHSLEPAVRVVPKKQTSGFSIDRSLPTALPLETAPTLDCPKVYVQFQPSVAKKKVCGTLKGLGGAGREEPMEGVEEFFFGAAEVRGASF